MSWAGDTIGRTEVSYELGGDTIGRTEVAYELGWEHCRED